MKDVKLNLKYGLIMAFYYAAFCMICMFSNVYLRSEGYDPATVGLILGLGNFGGVILQQVSTQIADKSRAITIRALALIQLLLPLAGLAPLFFFDMPKWFSGTMIFLTMSLEMSVLSILNAISVAYVDAGRHVNFGVGRGMGSIGYALTSIGLGMYFKTGPAHHYVIILMGFHVLAAIILMLLPRIPRPVMVVEPETAKEAVKAAEYSWIGFFRRYPIFIPLVVGLTLIYTSHVLINNFMLYVVEAVGGNSDTMGNAAALAALLEMTMMFSYVFWRKKFGDRALVIVATIVFTIKIALLLIPAGIPGVYFSQIFQFGAFGLITPAMTYYCAELVDQQDLVRGQSVAVIPLILGGGFGSLLGGVLIDFIGMHPTLLWATLVSLVGTLICLNGFRREKARAKA